MRVKLADLKPNPLRDFTVDPIDQENVKRLRQSIRTSGFWGGVACRHCPADPKQIEIGAGTHRIEAAIQEGIKEADVYVGDFNDASMVRLYCKENSLQRGNTSTALAGSVASALRVIAKAALTGGLGKIFPKPPEDQNKVIGNLTSAKGIGWRLVLEFLLQDSESGNPLPGINEGSIKQQLQALKESGNYARIIREVQEEIEQETPPDEPEPEPEPEPAAPEASGNGKAAKKTAKPRQSKKPESARTKAACATQAAALQERIFDLEGCSKYFRNPHQLDEFRKRVTADRVREVLPVERQADLAREIVRLAKEEETELSGAFIREKITQATLNIRQEKKRLEVAERESILRANATEKAKSLQRDFDRNCRGMAKIAVKIAYLIEKEWPDGLPFPILGEFRSALASAQKAVNRLSVLVGVPVDPMSSK